MSLFDDLQASIEALYKLDRVEPVEDFRLSEAHLCLLGDHERPRLGREALVIDQGSATTSWVGLFIAEETRAAAERFLVERDPSGIDAFVAVVEGVSHFVYFMHCAEAQQRPLSRIELELQAEVDKYLVLSLEFPSPDLVEQLFVNVRFAEDLSSEDVERYWLANDRAHQYARWIERKRRKGGLAEAIEDARSLYRKPFVEKLSHIARAA